MKFYPDTCLPPPKPKKEKKGKKGKKGKKDKGEEKLIAVIDLEGQPEIAPQTPEQQSARQTQTTIEPQGGEQKEEGTDQQNVGQSETEKDASQQNTDQQ